MNPTNIYAHPKVFHSDSSGINSAIKCIDKGGIAILPADTVYAVFARADIPETVERVYNIKKRERRKPFVIYTNKEKVKDIVHINPSARLLIDRVWPQGLSLILPKKPLINDWFTHGLSTVAVLTAQNKVIVEVVREVSAPIFGTSVNVSGDPEVKTAAEIMPFIDQVDMLIADDSLPIYNQASTMLDCTVDPPKIARLTSISLEYLRTIIPEIGIELSRRIA
jgi:L-threonylcarbamoyladenylate synthase